MTKTIEVIVATHKPYEFPDSELYRPIHVGKAIKNNDFGVEGDHTGENISLKNPSFCELTALYAMWKNPEQFTCDYIGLVHYRRYFKGSGLTLKGKGILSQKEITEYLSSADCILPKQRNYYIETIRTHYKNAHHLRDLQEVERILSEKHPEYTEAFNKVFDGKKLHLYNMFVMKREDFEAYCTWLFDILFVLEKRIDINHYDSYQSRIFGFLSERLFNVWIEKNELNVAYVTVCNIEGENLFKKAMGLLRRKFLVQM